MAECVSLGTGQLAEVVKEAAGEEHAVEVLKRWEGFGRFCRSKLRLEPLTVTRAWELTDVNPAEVSRQVYPDAKADGDIAAAAAGSLARR